jgi:hypothetical protein
VIVNNQFQSQAVSISGEVAKRISLMSSGIHSIVRNHHPAGWFSLRAAALNRPERDSKKEEAGSCGSNLSPLD